MMRKARIKRLVTVKLERTRMGDPIRIEVGSKLL